MLSCLSQCTAKQVMKASWPQCKTHIIQRMARIIYPSITYISRDGLEECDQMEHFTVK